jgi:hypothetical protein
MGFSLKLFFEEIENIYRDQRLSAAEKLNWLEKTIKNAKQYAKECGQLK